ncbi:hypothetical protein Tco_0248262 [Tanacetum coccineum]
MGCCLTSWFSKKQTTLAISTTEAEYVFAGKACQQALWIKQALVDYDIKLDDVPALCDNKGAIDLSKNHVLHSRTKHIEMRHHFLRDNVQKGNISIEKAHTKTLCIAFTFLKTFLLSAFCTSPVPFINKVDVVFDGAFRGVGDEEVFVGEGVVVISSSLDMLINSCLGGIMMSLIFLEGLDEEVLVEFMVEWYEEDEDDDRSGEDDLFN